MVNVWEKMTDTNTLRSFPYKAVYGSENDNLKQPLLHLENDLSDLDDDELPEVYGIWKNNEYYQRMESQGLLRHSRSTYNHEKKFLTSDQEWKYPGGHRSSIDLPYLRDASKVASSICMKLNAPIRSIMPIVHTIIMNPSQYEELSEDQYMEQALLRIGLIIVTFCGTLMVCIMLINT